MAKLLLHYHGDAPTLHNSYCIMAGHQYSEEEQVFVAVMPPALLTTEADIFGNGVASAGTKCTIFAYYVYSRVI